MELYPRIIVGATATVECLSSTLDIMMDVAEHVLRASLPTEGRVVKATTPPAVFI